MRPLLKGGPVSEVSHDREGSAAREAGAEPVHGRPAVASGFVNFRDVGGLHTADGRQVAAGRLFRADWPDSLSGATARSLTRVPVTRVVDLRDDEEVRHSADHFRRADFNVVRVPIFGGSAASLVADGVSLTELYTSVVTDTALAVTRAVAAVADAPRPGAVLVHCTAGKDRTGIVVALALSAVGVTLEEVAADYSATELNLRGAWLTRRLEVLGRYHGYDLSDRAELLAGSPAAVIEHTVGSVERAWGSVPDYLLAHGLTAEQLGRLRTVLLEPPGTEGEA